MSKAHTNTPIYSEILRALEAAIQGRTYESLESRTEKMLSKLETQLEGTIVPKHMAEKPSETLLYQTQAPTYAAVAKTATKTQTTGSARTPKTVFTKPTSERSPSTPTTTLPSTSTKAKKYTSLNQTSKSPHQLVLLTKKNHQLPKYSPMAVRDAINTSMIKEGKTKGPVVASVTTSINHNIVLTTIAPYNAEVLKDALPTWKNAFKDFPIADCQIQKPWIKLVAHGIPIEAGNQFQTECETFNLVRVKGTPRWLKKPTKPAGSMVFAVESQQEQQHCLTKGLFIAGKRITVVNFKSHSEYSQCFRCQGFGHDPTKCKKRVACKLCAGKHQTKSHTCTTCNANSKCTHLELKCANCGGQHPANSHDCEILRAVRGVSATQPQTTSHQINDK